MGELSYSSAVTMVRLFFLAHGTLPTRLGGKTGTWRIVKWETFRQPSTVPDRNDVPDSDVYREGNCANITALSLRSGVPVSQLHRWG